jgi:hypothetical protein
MTDEMSRALMAARDAAEHMVGADDPDVSAAAEKLLDCTAPDDDGEVNEHEHLVAALELIAAIGVGHGDDLPGAQ